MDRRYSSHPGIGLIRLPCWAAALAVIAAALLCLLLIVLAAGLALVIIPVAIVGGLIMRWRLRCNMTEAAHSGNIIDAEYRIVDRERQSNL